jgi:hypothetical protein
LPTKRATKAPPSDRAVEQADYAAWKILAGADLLGRHDVKPGTIPERLWRRLYIQGIRPPSAPTSRLATGCVRDKPWAAAGRRQDKRR